MSSLKTKTTKKYIVTANDMHTALKERLVKGTTAAVGSVDESNMNAEVKN